ncbi:hypothetical protein EBS02_10285 [bacterium]|nr:hypothetical protein [bacterium]
MDNISLSDLNARLELFRKDISEKIAYLSANEKSLSQEEVNRRIEDIKNLQSEIQEKTYLYFDKLSESNKKSFSGEDLESLTNKAKNLIKGEN